MAAFLGVDPERIFPHAEFELGTVAQSEDREDVFVRYLADVLAGEVVQVSRAHEASLLTIDIADATLGSQVGVANADALAGQYGFCMVRGLEGFYVEADTTPRASLYASATAGVLSSEQGENVNILFGIVSQEATAMERRVQGELNNPLLGAPGSAGAPETPIDPLDPTNLTRYSVFLGPRLPPPALPTEEQWLAGNTSETDEIIQPGGGMGNFGRAAFAIPAHMDSLTQMWQTFGFQNSRFAFDPEVGDPDVIVTIGEYSYKTYVEATGGAGVNFDIDWTLGVDLFG